MIQATEIFYFVFGALTLIGGIVGYWKTKMFQTLALGVICGLSLLGAGLLIYFGDLRLGLIIGLLATAGLSGQFIPKVMMNRAAPHVIIMAMLSGIGMMLTLIAFYKK